VCRAAQESKTVGQNLEGAATADRFTAIDQPAGNANNQLAAVHPGVFIHSFLFSKAEQLGNWQAVEVVEPHSRTGGYRLRMVWVVTPLEWSVVTVIVPFKSARAMRGPVVALRWSVATVVMAMLRHAVTACKWCGWHTIHVLALLGHTPTRHGVAGVTLMMWTVL
jgi:hypothetical protein